MKDLKGMKVKLRELIGGEVDEYTVYEGIAEEIEKHKVVNHGKREWARGEAHVNGCGNGFLRTYLRYRGVSDIATMKEMIQAIREFDDDTEVCVVAVTAAGDKAFSTGVDMRGHMPDRSHEMLETFRENDRNTNS